jgi:hypothetical protein
MADENSVSENDEGTLRDSEVALMDALKTTFDLMMYAGVKPAQIDKLLAEQCPGASIKILLPSLHEHQKPLHRR